MHSDVMRNVTTNETIRKKWNAKKDRDSNATSVTNWQKYRYLYWEPLPRSRLGHYFEIREETVKLARRSKAKGQTSIVSMPDDENIESEVSKRELRARQEELL